MPPAKNTRGRTMASDRANDLQAFKSFIDEKLANGGADLTLDEALARWEFENSSEEEREETRAAIRQGLADIDAGRVRPFEDFDREFRAKHGIPPRA
jgi:predicted transcriptional regulator